MPVVIMEPPSLAKASTGSADDAFYEIIDGQRAQLPPMSAYAIGVACSLSGELDFFARTHPLGRPFTEMLFRLPLNGSCNRRPDVAFVTYERWPKNRPMPATEHAWDVVPDLAVEVISPHDLVHEIAQKLTEYFQAGVRLVWVVHPLQRLV